VHQFLPFIVIGLATGAVYGLAGMGLVLTYTTSGIFNFGYGAVAALGAFCFYFLHIENRIAWPLAAAITIGVLAPLVGLGLELMARSLDGASETIKVVATVGLILIVSSLGLLWHPTNPPIFPHFLPQSTVRILGVNITWEQIILFVFSVVAAAILYWFFQSVRLGIVMRGVVDNHELVSMSGDDPVRVRRWAWIIGTGFAAVAGMMLAPTQPLDGVTLTVLVFAAFGAAAIGYFRNLPLTFVGGLLIGIAGALVDKYSATISWIGGLPPSLPFLVLFVVLVVTPKSRLIQRRVAPQTEVRRTYHAPIPVRLVAGAVAVGLLAIVPVVQANYLTVWSAALIDMILFLSLGLLVRRSGQISLCQLTFAAVGAAAFGHFAAEHIPWLVALLLAALVAVPVGALVAIPAVRVSGVFLALATLGFGILVEEVFYTREFMFGGTPLGIAAPRPNYTIGSWNLSTDTGFYYLLLVIVVLTVVVVTAVSSDRLGRLLEGMSESPLALETHGAPSSVLKVIVFCLAAAMAAVAGAFTGMLYSYAVGTYFESFNSLTLVVLVVIITIGDPWYAVLAAIGYTVIPGYIHFGGTTSTVLQLLFGVGAACAAYSTRGGTTPAAVQAFLDRVGGRKTKLVAPQVADRPVPVSEPAGDRSSAATTEPVVRVGLEVLDLSVRFGGIQAVDRVSLKAPTATITGLVGPNGAGKTTIFDACSGLNRPHSGQIIFEGVNVNREGTARRARRGLGRTFQRTELFNGLTVRQNVALGREAAIAGANPAAQLHCTSRTRRFISAVTEEALAVTGTAHIADEQVGLLPIGQRRLVELARALAGPFDLLLLDEPSSGLDGHETEEFGRVLKTVVQRSGRGVLLVEHDMTLVRQICDYVFVLDFGSLIFEGTPDDMQNSDQVRAAYLGDAFSVAVGARERPPPEAQDRIPMETDRGT
jgi:ABC-type branched-subunit amino acid transport system ATPase component/branched-subunit amino acid ABC-type transport system permease component